LKPCDKEQELKAAEVANFRARFCNGIRSTVCTCPDRERVDVCSKKDSFPLFRISIATKVSHYCTCTGMQQHAVYTSI
jgi:hypothetical protein